MSSVDPFHEGERWVQERSGERETARRNAGIVASVLPSRAMPFLSQQWMLPLAVADSRPGVRASVLFGDPGFVRAPDQESVILERARLDPLGGAAIWSVLSAGKQVGLLAIDLTTRRRLRINGTILRQDARQVVVRVAEAYPNCPKYVQRRALLAAAGDRVSDDVLSPERGEALDDSRAGLIARADTLFVGSRHPERGADVSHRGGLPGFVRVVSAKHLRIPDYQGNGMFNTFGNFAVDGSAALAVLDFARGRLLELTGTAELQFDLREDPARPTGSTGRYWDFHVAHWVDRFLPSRFSLGPAEYSAHNPPSLE